MKKIITVSLLTLALNATAGWGGNNSPWGNNGFSNGPWGGSNNNGFIGNNPYSMFTPDWFSEEMDDMMDEFDSNNSGPWGNQGFNKGPWGNQGFNKGPWGNQGFNKGPWGNQTGPWNNNTWKNGPWSNYGYNRAIPTAADTGTK